MEIRAPPCAENLPDTTRPAAGSRCAGANSSTSRTASFVCCADTGTGLRGSPSFDYRSLKRNPWPCSATCQLGWSSNVGGTRNAGARRAHRVRAARHVRPVLRRDRSHRRALPDRGQAARQPRAPPGAGNGDGSRRRSHQPAGSCGRFPGCRRCGDFDALLAVLDPDVVVRADRAAVPAGAPTEVRGTAAVANRAIKGGARAARPALVDRAVGVIVAPRGRLPMVLHFKITRGKIVEIEAVADPERLRQLDLAVLNP
jgi:hypothetical protein